mmetsp:Transcript_9740/g.16206  ORF Transcript_9740/g.16206 Transcript_9740/m.16206 type:complete len:94 (+) Transcript_9740:451-732(+)
MVPEERTSIDVSKNENCSRICSTNAGNGNGVILVTLVNPEPLSLSFLLKVCAHFQTSHPHPFYMCEVFSADARELLDDFPFCLAEFEFSELIV